MHWGPYIHHCQTGIKMYIAIKLSIYLLYWYFQQNQCLNIENMLYTAYID